MCKLPTPESRWAALTREYKSKLANFFSNPRKFLPWTMLILAILSAYLAWDRQQEIMVTLQAILTQINQLIELLGRMLEQVPPAPSGQN